MKEICNLSFVNPSPLWLTAPVLPTVLGAPGAPGEKPRTGRPGVPGRALPPSASHQGQHRLRLVPSGQRRVPSAGRTSAA